MRKMIDWFIDYHNKLFYQIPKSLATTGVETSSTLHQLKTKSVISGVTPPPIRTELWAVTSIPRLDIYGGRIKVFCVPVDDWLVFLHCSLNVAICFLVMQTTVETKNWTTSLFAEVITKGAALAINCGSEHAWVQTVRTCILKRGAPFLNVPGTVRNDGRNFHENINNLV